MYKAIVAACAALTLSACMQTETEMTQDMVSPEEATIQSLVGKRLSNDQGYATLHADGRVTGEFGGAVFAGTWTVVDGQYCRSGSIGERELPYECQDVSVNGSEVSFTPPGGDARIFTMG
ncbi:hypothetical protein [Aestuariibius sp. HNIBRBA575]|uniref:hypothetical protein n=1 Tax=Aestuariibius sp. HNIBRBA575 TaxID=3233343 RepID=UPI0034A1421E